ncbi:hypothetical protein Pelo_18654 [Pelomyxa schiedti]|nr:hypothetical protein Pelo_18654 [Pelomyxa schiedti]
MRLGTMYTKGTSATPQNFTLALKHFQAAVEQGNPQAAFAVAQLILFGYVPGATTREALELLHKACTPSIPDEVASTIGGVYEGGGGGTGDKGNAQQKLRPYLHPASNEDEED